MKVVVKLVIENFTKSCNKNIIQSIESQFDQYLFDRDIFFRRIDYKLRPPRDNDNNSDDESVATTVCISMDSASDSDRDELKREIEDSDYDSPRNGQRQSISAINFELRVLLFSYFGLMVVTVECLHLV